MSTSLHIPYRKIWHDHYGDIPIDEHGMTYEIHHINGDHNDNRIENLKCVSIVEHYEIHKSQGDWHACSAILQRIKRNIDLWEGLVDHTYLKGENHPMYGKTHTEESRKKISENHADVSGKNNPMYGKTHSDESKRKMSEKKTGVSKGPMSKKAKKNMSNSKKEYWAKNKSSRVKRIKIDDVIYADAIEASKAYNIDPVNVRRRCRLDKYENWNYIE